jgi:hypothetical protein
MGWYNWIDLSQDMDQLRALANTVKNLLVPKNSGRFLRSCPSDGLSRSAQIHEVNPIF